jgi:sugar lactone lactonase YvrE
MRTQQAAHQAEVVARIDGPMPTGVAVSRAGRTFLSFPRWGDAVPFTVGEWRNGRPVAYPDAVTAGTQGQPKDRLVSVQSVVVDARDRLWLLDTGSVEFQPVQPGVAKLVRVDLSRDRIVQTIHFPEDVVLPTTYLNDVRFDLDRGGEGFAIISDSGEKGPNGLIVVDLASGKSWRRLNGHRTVTAQPGFMPRVEGRQLAAHARNEGRRPLTIGVDGIAIDRVNRRVYYCPLAGRTLASVSLDVLEDPNASDAQVVASIEEYVDRDFASDGLECDPRGLLYLTDYENHCIRRPTPAGRYEIVAQAPESSWPDSMAWGPDGNLFVMCNQLHRQPRFQAGVDQRRPPYPLLRVRMNAAGSSAAGGDRSKTR